MKKPKPQTEIDALNDAAWELRNSNALKAISMAEEVLVKTKLINYKKGIADSLHTISYCQATRTAKYEEARANGHAALEIYIASNDEVSKQKVLNTFGLIEGISGNMLGAINYFNKSLKLANKLKLSHQRAMALHNLAVSFEGINDYNRSLDYNLQALKIYEELQNDNDVFKTLQNIGVIYFNLEKYDESLESLLKTVEIFKNDADKDTQGLAFLNIGRSYHKLKNYQQALDSLNKSLALLEGTGNRLVSSDALAEISIVYMDMQRFLDAKEHISKSIKIKKELNDSSGLASSYYYLGKLLFQQGEKAKALTTFTKALNLAETAQAKTQLQNINKELASSYQQIKDYEKAFQYLSAYLELRDELFEKASYERTQALLIHHSITQEDKDKEIMRRNKELKLANENLKLLTLELDKQAKEDSLTKLYNRRYFDSLLEKEFSRSKRYHKPMAVMICDIDNFKQVNDNFSHQVGDQVLIKIAEIFMKNIRRNDTIARFGGEEFVALFPESDVNKAFEICERLRNSVEKYPWSKISSGLKVTISIGICDDTSLANGETMISKADSALYEVKENGKNHSRIWDNKEMLIA